MHAYICHLLKKLGFGKNSSVWKYFIAEWVWIIMNKNYSNKVRIDKDLQI